MQRLIKIVVSIISTLHVSAHVSHLQVLTAGQFGDYELLRMLASITVFSCDLIPDRLNYNSYRWANNVFNNNVSTAKLFMVEVDNWINW
jgi:hypothetical protein